MTTARRLKHPLDIVKTTTAATNKHNFPAFMNARLPFFLIVMMFCPSRHYFDGIHNFCSRSNL